MWFIFGLIVGAGILTLVLWLRNRNIGMKWYEWLIGVIGLGLLLLMIQNIIGSVREMETLAAWQFLWIIGLPALILLSLAWWLPWRRHRKTSS
jgi:hypothetical protein